MEYVICVPSFKRPELCNEKTLTMLHKNKIPAKKINVYVANIEEFEEYKQKLNREYYNEIIIGKVGLVKQRQFIMNQFKKNTNLIFIDDDVSAVDLSLSMFKNKSLHQFFEYAFHICYKENSYIWGVYPVYNPFFRKDRKEITTDLNLIVGAFYGIINRPKLKSIQLTNADEKEDTYRTIKYFIQDGIVIRFNKVGFQTKYYGKSGGMGNKTKRLKPSVDASNKLKELYPEYGNVFIRKNGIGEFKLKKNVSI